MYSSKNLDLIQSTPGPSKKKIDQSSTPDLRRSNSPCEKVSCQRRNQEISLKLLEAEELIKEKDRELEIRISEISALQKTLNDRSEELHEREEELALSKSLVESLRQGQSQSQSQPDSAPRKHPIEGRFHIEEYSKAN